MKNGTELENERINPSGYLHFRLLRGAKGLAMTRGRKGEWLRATFTKGRGMGNLYEQGNELRKGRDGKKKFDKMKLGD